MITIVVHGGAGNWKPEHHAAALDGITRAVDAGHAVLAAGGEALAAVQAAVIVLEDDPVFNAGRGAALDERGRVLHDAAIMRGADRAAGAVAALRGIRNPVRAARAVLDEGRHVMLVGEAAGTFAREAGLDTAAGPYFITEERRRRHEHGTVGAVALDDNGGVAAATSTGGIDGKHPGRVGDSPLIAAGTWADDTTVAISCTGDGEAIIRVAMAHEVDALVRLSDRSLEDACTEALAELERRGGHGGLIAVSAAGEHSAQFSSPGMTRGWRVGDGPVHTAVGAG